MLFIYLFLMNKFSLVYIQVVCVLFLAYERTCENSFRHGNRTGEDHPQKSST